MSEQSEGSQEIQVTDEQSFNDALKVLEGEHTPPEGEPTPGQPTGEPKEAKGEVVEKTEEAPPKTTTDLYKALTDQDRELRELRKQVKQTGKVEDYKTLAEKDPEAFLDKFGFTFDKLFDIFANKDVPASDTPEATPKESDSALVKKVEALERALAEQKEHAEKARMQKVYEKNLSALYSTATSDMSRWHFVNKAQDEGSLNLAYKVAGHIYEQTGQQPQLDAVLDEVETYLETEAKKRSEWLTAKTPPQKDTQPPAERQQESVPTLDGSIGDTEAPQELTDQDRFDLALKELQKEE